jgi:LysM repeat protein
VTEDEPAVTGGEVYVVEEGDTLWSIAQDYDTTVEAIVAANDLDEPESIAIGDELIIPPPDESAASEDTSASDDSTYEDGSTDDGELPTDGGIPAE